jgi:ribosomal subunit interface protein
MRYNRQMDIRIKTTDYEMVPEVSDYIDERIAVIEKHLGGDADTARIEVNVGRASGKHHSDHMWFAEIDIQMPGGAHAHATNNESSINAAIDRAKEEIMTQLHKEKQVNRRELRQVGSEIKESMRIDDGDVEE